MYSVDYFNRELGQWINFGTYCERTAARMSKKITAQGFGTRVYLVKGREAWYAADCP